MAKRFKGGVRQEMAESIRDGDRTIPHRSPTPDPPRKRKNAPSSVAKPTDFDDDGDPEPHPPIDVKDSFDMYRQQLKRLFVTKLSGKDVQETALFAEHAGAKGAHDIVTAGNSGQQGGNIQRDIRRRIAKDSSMPQPYFLPVPCHDPLTHENQKIVMIFVLLIHEIFLWLIESARVVMSSIVGSALDITSGHYKSLVKFCSDHSLPFDNCLLWIAFRRRPFCIWPIR